MGGLVCFFSGGSTLPGKQSARVGSSDGELVGWSVGSSVGVSDGTRVGESDGVADAPEGPDGCISCVGAVLGVMVGSNEGVSLDPSEVPTASLFTGTDLIEI